MSEIEMRRTPFRITVTDQVADVAQLKERIRQLEEVCEVGLVDVDTATLRIDLDKAREAVEEARMWACHGYELAQRSCTWVDHGVAPRWLIDSYRESA